jgi:hypothetical protein
MRQTFIGLFILCVFLSIISVSQAQNSSVDVVYLKNGSEIRGEIIELVVNDYIKIETVGGSVFVFKMDEVLKIERETSSINTEPQEERVQAAESRSSDIASYPSRNRNDGLYMGLGYGTSSGGLGTSIAYKQGVIDFHIGLGTYLDPSIVGYNAGIRLNLFNNAYINTQFGAVGIYYRKRGGSITEKGTLIGPSMLFDYNIKFTQSVYLKLALGGGYVINSEKLLWAQSQFDEIMPAFDLSFHFKI